MRRLPKRGELLVWLEVIVVLGVAVALFTLGAGVIWATVVPLPSIQNFESRRVAESTKIYDRTGNVILYDVHGSMRRTEVPLEDISIHIRNATIAIEDATFYEHNGFRPLSFLRAVLVNLRLREGFAGQGGSTITQQVVKNTLLTTDKTLTRKAKEIILALRLERVYSKDEILETYLNEAPYGGTIYGVEEASKYFFGVSASDVTLAQAAYLAALPQAPTRYSPYGSRRDELEARQDLVLSRMLENGFIDEATYEEALAEEVEFQSEAEVGIKAPHFVFYVREYLEEKYGPEVVANGGLQVITTLDYDLQQEAERIVREHALANERNFNAENAGLVAIDPKTGQVLAMVGSRGFFDENIDGMVNVTVTPQQPGSAFKPFVYATAFKKGYTPETVVFDLKTQFTAHCEPNDLETHDDCYSPDNYDNVFRGPISFRNALAQSVNIPAVKVLYLAGIDDSIDTARSMGITTLENKDRYGLTLVLGGGEVYLLDMVGAYATFANDGVRNPPAPIQSVTDRNGDVLEEYEEHAERVMEPQIARAVSDILSDNIARAPAFGETSALSFTEHAVAVKTGTTNDYRDAWIVGYTPTISAGAWAGNNDNSPMEKRVAGFIVAPMWREFMDYALEKYPPGPFTPPSPESNLESIPPVLRGEWNTDSAQGVHEILHWVDKDNPRGGRPTNPWGDSQYAHWEYPVAVWAGQQASTTPGVLVPGAGGMDFSIILPLQNSTFSGSAAIPVLITYPSGIQVSSVSFYLNNEPVGSSDEPPFYFSLTTAARGEALLRVVFDTPSGPVERTAAFTIQ
ncbi:PBP1A family penicillin-binding protein [Candidatus Parcubacteria bacterium]|nr:MAG: PBP1A family penicillin-binding protein [Candidatus Parcubacteria bacterium]